MRFFLLFALLLSTGHARQCYFTPPTGWEIAQLKNPSPHVKIGFIGIGSTPFRPSINLASESVDVSLKEYVQAVKKIQMEDPTVQWRDLGKLSMKGGLGRLIEMTNSSPFGQIKILQAFLLKGDTVYILTAALLKEELAQFQTDLLKSFQSMTLIDDLSSLIDDPQDRNAFQTLYSSLGSSDEDWETLQKQVKSLTHMGPYWQFLALQKGHSKIYNQGNEP
jgi:hypothetical protein